jgi:hypothetical protein
MAPNRTRPGESGNPADKSQIEKFQDLAREIGADEDEEAFKAKVQRVASAARQPKVEKKR